MKPKPVYIASPYSPTTKFQKLPIISSIVKFLRARQITRITANLLEEHNIAPICPITCSRQLAKFMKPHDGSFSLWKHIDYSYIDRVDEVWVIMMRGWQESTGVQSEIKYAKRKKIPVIYFTAII